MNDKVQLHCWITKDTKRLLIELQAMLSLEQKGKVKQAEVIERSLILLDGILKNTVNYADTKQTKNKIRKIKGEVF